MGKGAAVASGMGIGHRVPAGFVLLLPNALTLTSAACLFLAIELQVRAVEEPYLLRTHGEAYAAYCGRVGRFVPGLGLLDAR